MNLLDWLDGKWMKFREGKTIPRFPEDYCDFCEEPLDDSKPWQRSAGGYNYHEDCLEKLRI